MRTRLLLRAFLIPRTYFLHENNFSFKPASVGLLLNRVSSPSTPNCPFSTLRDRPIRKPRDPFKENDLYRKFKLTEDEDDDDDEVETPTAERKFPDGSAEKGDERPPEPPAVAQEIFKKMKETGMIPNAVAMLDGLCKDGLVQDAMKLFGLMREKGTIPEVVIYTAVVDGFCKAMQLDDAKRVFKKMQSNAIVPNAYSYTVIVQGLCKGNKLEDAVDYCCEMLEAGHFPNVATFVMLVDGFCKQNRAGEVEGVIGRLREKGFALDEKGIREHLDKKGPFTKGIRDLILRRKTL